MKRTAVEVKIALISCFKFLGTKQTVPHEEKSQHISLIITPTFASENDYTQTFSRKAFVRFFFVRIIPKKSCSGHAFEQQYFVSAFK